MAVKQTSILEFPGVTEDTYEVYDEQARTDASNALSVANGKLKSVTLKATYKDSSKTLSISLETSTN